MQNKDFAVFILTHGRPDNVVTATTLKKCGYTGRIYLIVDNEDKTINQYIENFGKESVIIFDKKSMADSIDEGNNFDERRTITHARNACFNIAKELGITYFIELDDDYVDFRHKAIETNNSLFLVKNLDTIFDSFLKLYKTTNLKSVAFSQGGDFIGGIDSGIDRASKGSQEHYRGKRFYRFSRRKCMNSFICSTEKEFQFVGAMNEDVNTYTTLGSRGDLFLTIPFIALQQKQTQAQTGGITDMYLRYGTYCKAFTTVMMQPSSVKVSMMNSNNPRLHHSIKWINTVPVIIREEHKKA